MGGWGVRRRGVGGGKRFFKRGQGAPSAALLQNEAPSTSNGTSHTARSYNFGLLLSSNERRVAVVLGTSRSSTARRVPRFGLNGVEYIHAPETSGMVVIYFCNRNGRSVPSKSAPRRLPLPPRLARPASLRAAPHRLNPPLLTRPGIAVPAPHRSARCIYTCRTQNPDIPQAGRGEAARTAGRRGSRAGQNGTPTGRFAQERTCVFFYVAPCPL